MGFTISDLWTTHPQLLWDRRRASGEHIRSVQLSTNKAELLSVKSTFGKPLAGEVSNLDRSNSCLNGCYLAEWKPQAAFTPNLMMQQKKPKTPNPAVQLRWLLLHPATTFAAKHWVQLRFLVATVLRMQPCMYFYFHERSNHQWSCSLMSYYFFYYHHTRIISS